MKKRETKLQLNKMNISKLKNHQQSLLIGGHVNPSWNNKNTCHDGTCNTSLHFQTNCCGTFELPNNSDNSCRVTC